MPDNEINWNLTGHDDISPILRAIENELARVGSAGAMAGKQFADGFAKAKVSLETASKMQELSGLPMQSALKSYIKQITDVNSSIKYLFEQRGGVEALLLEQGKRGFERQFRDPYGKPPTPIESEGMKRLADATAKAASEMASLGRFQKEARAESERLAIAMENIAEMAKAASATRLAESEAQAASEARELAAFEKEAAQFRERSAIALEKIAELEGIARKEAEALAIAEKEAAQAEAIQLAESIERIRAMKPAIPYEEEGGGGAGKHFGGFLQETVKGFQRGGPIEALKSGLQSFASGMLSMASWILEWEVIQKAMELAASALENVVKEFQIGYLWANRLGGATRETAASFDALKSAAWFSGQSLDDTFKRVEEFRTHGFSADQAIREAQIVGQIFKQTNVDITGAVTKAKELGAGIEDLRTIAQAGHPELLPEVDRLSVEQNLRPVEQMIRSRNHELQQQKMEDTITVQQREMDERQRLEEDNFHQSTRLMEREMQARHLARNRDLEDEQRNIEQSMQARHRAAEQAEQDFDRLHNRQNTLRQGIKGLTEGAFQEFQTRQRVAAPMSGLQEAQEAMRKQMEAGATQLEKDLGLRSGLARQMAQAGLIQPQTLLQEAEVGREEERVASSRARETESIQTGIALQKKATLERRQQQDEELKKTKEIQDEEYAMQKRNQLTRLAWEYALQDTQRKFQRDYQNQEFAFQLKYGALQLYISQKILEIHEEDDKKRIEADKKLHGQAPPAGLERGRLPGQSWGLYGEPEGSAPLDREQHERAPVDILRDYIKDLQKKLDSLGSGVDEQKKSTDEGTTSTKDATKSNTDLTGVNKNNTTATTDNNKALTNNTSSLGDLKDTFDRYLQSLQTQFGGPPPPVGAGAGAPAGGAIGGGAEAKPTAGGAAPAPEDTGGRDSAKERKEQEAKEQKESEARTKAWGDTAYNKIAAMRGQPFSTVGMHTPPSDSTHVTHFNQATGLWERTPIPPGTKPVWNQGKMQYEMIPIPEGEGYGMPGGDGGGGGGGAGGGGVKSMSEWYGGEIPRETWPYQQYKAFSDIYGPGGKGTMVSVPGSVSAGEEPLRGTPMESARMPPKKLLTPEGYGGLVPGQGFAPDYSKGSYRIGAGPEQWYEVKPPGPGGKVKVGPGEWAPTPAPGGKPTTQEVPQKGKESNLATEATLAKISEALKKVFTGGGG